MNRPLLSLVAIVKDEAKAIRPTLESVRGVVDRWDILDTGSVDGTREVVLNLLATEEGADDKPLEGCLHRAPFVDYATARNDALNLAATGVTIETGEKRAIYTERKAARYALILSADEVLVGGDRLRAFLLDYSGPETAFLVELRTATDVSLSPRVVKISSPWRYEGAFDERLVNRTEKKDPTLQIPGVAVEHRASDPERRLRRLVEVGVPALKREMEEHPDEPVRLRAMMLLAQAYENIALATKTNRPGGAWISHMTSAMGLYMRRIESGGDPAEVEAATMHFLNVAESLALFSDEEMLRKLGPLERSRLPEVHFMIASHVARLDASAGYDRAVAAARIARSALREPTTRPVHRAILWNCHLVAAHSARAIGNAEAARKSAEAGIDAGGPGEAFAEFFPKAREPS